MSQIVGILLPIAVSDLYDYKIPNGKDISLGDFVSVSFGRKEEIGIVWKIGKSANIPDSKIKTIKEKLDLPSLTPSLMKFIETSARYNINPLGSVLKMTLSVKDALQAPKTTTSYELNKDINIKDTGLKITKQRQLIIDCLNETDKPLTKKQISDITGTSTSTINPLIEAKILKQISIITKAVFERPQANHTEVSFSDEQEEAVKNLYNKVGKGFSATLLDGITGSGKTEVYFEAIAKAIEEKKQVLILLPEISLTNQLLNRFKKRFGCYPASWHSNLTAKQRRETWQAVANNEISVIIGARSALFLPYNNLGLTIIDECHDGSYKQEDVVNYHARDMAVLRAKIEDFPILLSTATPSIETINNVEVGKFDLIKLTKRYSDAKLPKISSIDIKRDKPQKGEWGTSWLSPTLVKEIEKNLENKEQSLLFLNRRGYAPLTICRTCGHRIQCPNCTAWLTEHKKTGQLTCHHCGFFSKLPKKCPECEAEDEMVACGPGIERIAIEAKKRFPDTKVATLSSDSLTNIEELKSLISKIENNEIDIIIGTQILAKGHNFPNLTLVGIIDADLGLMGGDLRASEKTFQLLSQVSGRAGRSIKEGRCYLQTCHPENKVIKALEQNNREAFLNVEKKERKFLSLPPFGKMASIIVTGVNQEKTEQMANYLGHIAPRIKDIHVLGPAPAPIFMLRNKFRYRLLIKTSKNINIQAIINKWLSNVKKVNNIRINIDIDPHNFL